MICSAQAMSTSITKLFGFQMSALILMGYDDGEKERLMRLGEFSVNLAMHINSPILATFCSVDEFEWPLTKDSVVIRIAKRTFAFALPGLLYGLQFPITCPLQLIHALANVFIKYAHFKDINDKGQGYQVEDNEPNMWSKLRAQFEPMAHETLKRLGQFPRITNICLLQNQNSCYSKAHRMSRCTNMIINSMRNGTLTNNFVKFIIDNNAREGNAYASIRAFSSVVEYGIELSWGVNDEDSIGVCSQDIGVKLWSLNEDGIFAFILSLDCGEKFDKGESRKSKTKGKRSLRYRRGNWDVINKFIIESRN